MKSCSAIATSSTTWSKLRGRTARRNAFSFANASSIGFEVWTVGRQEAEVRADALNRGLDLRLFVHRQVVEDDDVAWSQRRDEHLLDVGEKRGIVDRSIEDGRRVKPVRAQCGDDGVRVPMAARRVVAEPQASRRLS